MYNDEILDSDISFNDKFRKKIILTNNTNIIILFFATFGLYGIWWQYKAWKFFKEHQGLDIWSGARAFFSIFFIYALCEKIQAFARSRGINKFFSSGGVLGLMIVSSIFGNFENELWLFTFISLFCYLQPNELYNEAIQASEEYEGYVNPNFSNKQLILLVIGVILWGLVVIGLVMPE